MMRIHVSDENRRLIERHGEEGFPNEVCGFLVGKARGDEKTVAEVWPIANAWEQAGKSLTGASSEFLDEAEARRFFIPPEAWLHADRRAREQGSDILGCYHTHPNHPARPSVYDLEMARGTFPGYTYIILSVRHGKAAEMTSWVLRDDYSQFDAEEIVTAATAAPKEAATHA